MKKLIIWWLKKEQEKIIKSNNLKKALIYENLIVDLKLDIAIKKLNKLKIKQDETR